MKRMIERFFGLMVILGLLLFLGTAESSDIEVISLSTIFSQNLAAASLLIVGASGYNFMNNKQKKQKKRAYRRPEPVRIFSVSEREGKYAVSFSPLQSYSSRDHSSQRAI